MSIADKRLRQSGSVPHFQPGFDSPYPRQLRLDSSVVERLPEEQRVGGSIPSLGTILGQAQGCR